MSGFLNGVLQTLQSNFDPEALGSGMAMLLSKIIVGSLVFAAFYVAWRLAEPVARRLLRRTKLDLTNVSFVMGVLKTALLSLGGVQALAAVGVNMGALLASLGIAGLTIGFAARDALSNIISGVLIFWDRPFVIGDLVEVEGKYGRVENITLRSTRVVTPDGRMLAVPNTTIINTTVASYTNFPNLRIDVPVTISVNEDIGRVRETILGVVRADSDYMPEPPPEVVVVDLGDYNITVQAQAWLKDERANVNKRAQLRERIFEALRMAGVDMPFETIQLQPVDVRMQQTA